MVLCVVINYQPITFKRQLEMTNRTSMDRLILSTFKVSHLWLQMNILLRFNALDEALKGKMRGPLSLNSFNTPHSFHGPFIPSCIFPPHLCVAKGRGHHQKAVADLLASLRQRSAIISLTRISFETFTKVLLQKMCVFHKTMIRIAHIVTDYMQSGLCNQMSKIKYL